MSGVGLTGGSPNVTGIAPVRRVGRRQFVIYVGGVPKSGQWVARCYDDETGEHIWSSEGAATLHMALADIDRALGRLFPGV